MDGFVFTQQFNTPDSPFIRRHNEILCAANGRAPAGTAPTHACDGDGFQVAAGNLRRLLHIRAPTFIYDNTRPERQRERAICDALAACPSGLEFVAYLGHGVPSGLESGGIHLRNADRFMQLLADRCAPNASIVLYACSTGAPNGFAQALGEYLAPKNIWVWGHTSYGNYANLSMFVRYPGGVPWSGHGVFFNFWREDRAAFQEGLAIAGRQVADDLNASGLF